MSKKSTYFKLGISTIILFAILATAATVFASAASAGPTFWGIPTAKWWDLLWRTLNFAVLAIVLVKLLSKPFASGLKGRQQSIREEFEDLEDRKAEADKAYQVYEEKLAAIDQEIDEIIQNAIAQGEAEKERIIEDGKRAAQDMKRQAEMAIQHELAEAKLKLREDVANQAVLMAEELIRKNLQEADQVKLIEDYLAKVGTVQ
jgi:F-type H+-transporting ATPase subunit b